MACQLAEGVWKQMVIDDIRNDDHAPAYLAELLPQIRVKPARNQFVLTTDLLEGIDTHDSCTNMSRRSRLRSQTHVHLDAVACLQRPHTGHSLMAFGLEPIAGIKMCQAYRRQYGFHAISLMPTNLYGPNDNYDLQNSHVLPALIRKFHEAKSTDAPSVTVWGSGNPRREFLHVDDLADAALFLMQNYDAEEIINVGTGKDISIRELAEIVRESVGFTGKIAFDTSRPDGTPRKLLDVSRLNRMGWKAKIALRDGIVRTYRSFLDEYGK